MTRPILILATVALLAIGVQTSQGGELTGVRVLTVTSRNDATGEKHVDKFFVDHGDRLYVTRIEAEVIKPDGSVAGVDFVGGFRFGNMTLSREKP